MTFSVSYDSSACQFTVFAHFQISVFLSIFKIPVLWMRDVKCSVERESWKTPYQSNKKPNIIFKCSDLHNVQLFSTDLKLEE